MLSVASVIEKVLTHSYDPVKAHEYYIRTRELKGRQSGNTDAPETKKASAPKDPQYEAAQAKKDALHRSIDGKLADIENAMAPATGTKGSKKPKLYSEQDKAAIAAIVEDRKAKLEKIANDLYNENLRIGRERYAKLQAVPEVPKGLGILETRRRMEQRAEKIAKIKGDAQQAKDKASRDAAALKGDVVAKALAKRDGIQRKAKEKVAGQLTDAVNTASSEYEKLKQDLARLLGRP